MWASRRVELAVGASVIPLAIFHGGYAPAVWGWGAVACFWVAFLALVLQPTFALDRVLVAWGGALIALTAWTALSATWSQSVPRTMLEIERDLLYVAAILALALVVRRGSAQQLVAGIAVGTAAVVIGALAYYLLAANEVDVTQGYLLFRPVGYANALGGLIAMGVPLLLGLSIADGARRLQAVAAALVVISTVALYLTQNRSGWLALAAALVIWLLTTSAVSEAAAAIVLAAIPSAAAIVVVSRLDLLAMSGAGGRAGRAHLAAAVVMLFAGLAAACALLRPRVRIGRRVAVRAAQGGALAVSAALVAAGFHSGDRLHYWRAAVHGIEHHWLLGRGAGTFDEVWFRYRDVGRVVRDAHSLYLESLAELGLVGVLLIVIVLSIPLVAPRGSREPVLAAARGAYCAFLVHAAFEWDWEMPIVTLPALALGVALLLSRSGSRVIRVAAAARLGAATVVVLLTLFAVDALAGNAYLVAAERRALTGDNASAEARARHATRLLPWASEPWLVIADARAGAGDAAGTRDALRKAAARDPSDWLVWYRIAASSNGVERTAAIRRISLLNPRLVRRR